MPPQSVEVADTIAALKRALRREKEAPSDQPISSATNRGNKLKRGANRVHAGALPYSFGPNGYKEKIEHAGFTRYVLDRIPKQYNDHGDEVEANESDGDADTEADDENPYGDIRLEELLRPLTHPAELEHHPTLSHPYLDIALHDMAQTTEEKLRQERANLWRAKNLHRQFIGDESWMPCARVEDQDDWDLFEPHLEEGAKMSPGKKRKRDSDVEMAQNGVEKHDHAVSTNDELIHDEGGERKDDGLSDQIAGNNQDRPAIEQQVNGNFAEGEANGGGERPAELSEDANIIDGDAPKSNGTHFEQNITTAGTISGDPEAEAQSNIDQTMPVDALEENNVPSGIEDATAPEDTPPPAPTRRITRALATNNGSNSQTPPLSPTTSTISSIASSLLQPASLFLLPPTLSTAHATHPSTLPLHVAHSGLPLDEILETRRLLGMYIQKQEETIRGLEGVFGKLVKAKRMKERLWEWCKNEGHVGEWSDGEDWIDTEAWGVQEGELRKGRDEEEAIGEEEQAGRKGKRRRGRE